MRFYTRQHRFYCGVDLHARTLALCVLDAHGQVLARPAVAGLKDAIELLDRGEFDAAVPIFADAFHRFSAVGAHSMMAGALEAIAITHLRAKENW